jgi:hypothetical protein
MTRVDAGPSPGTPTYQLATVNSSDLESGKTEPVAALINARLPDVRRELRHRQARARSGSP